MTDYDFKNNATAKNVKSYSANRCCQPRIIAWLASTISSVSFPLKESVAGEEKATDYPRQDSASPWSGSGADPGVEAPLGVAPSINGACGEAFESINLADLGEPEPGASTQSRVPNQRLQSAAEGSGSPPPLVEAVGSNSTANAVVKSQAENSPVCDETASTNPSPHPDGLDVPRRADGMPLSSHAHAPN